MATDDGTVLRDGENELDDQATGDDSVQDTDDLDLGGGVTDDPGVETEGEQGDEQEPDGTDGTEGGGI